MLTNMVITRTSLFSGKVNTMDLPITQEQIDRWDGGELIQNVFPDFTPSQREFLITGITDEEWEDAFKDS
jgi:hypothetical protein